MTLSHGQTVHVHFTASAKGSIIESTADRDPLLVTIGAGQVVRGFEQALMRMHPGQSITVTVPAGDAYGAYDRAKVHSIPRHRFQSEPRLGETIHLQGPSEQQRVKGVVRGIEDDVVWLDFNHPLADEDITFEIELVDEDHEAIAGGH